MSLTTVAVKQPLWSWLVSHHVVNDRMAESQMNDGRIKLSESGVRRMKNGTFVASLLSSLTGRTMKRYVCVCMRVCVCVCVIYDNVCFLSVMCRHIV
jgi:hypothetical protein